MNAILRSWATPPALVVLLGLAAAGCGEDKKTIAPEADAGAPEKQKPVLDGKLGAAVRAAESAQAAGNAAPGKEGPPESGVFAPGFADKAQAVGAPAKIELLGEGTEPRIALALAPSDDEQRETITVGVRQGAQGGAVALDYALSLKIDKPKDKPKDDKPKDDKAAAGPKTFRVVATVTGVGTAAAVTKEDADRIAKLKGTELRYQIGADGSVDDIKITLAKDADPLLDGNVRALANALSVINVPLPAKPVGVGGYWIVTDRGVSYIGAEVVRYRVFKIEKIEKDRATISVDVRQYATREDLDLGAAGKGQKLVVARFESTGKAKLDWSAAAFLPSRAEASVRTQIMGHVQGGPAAQKGTIQTELAAKLAAVEGKADKKK
jgi:hypothetical protein